MSTKITLVYLVFVIFLATAATASAASDDNRYFVKSTSQFWQKSFQVRHAYDDGFTANLSDLQLRLAKVFGVEVTPVKKLNILAVARKAAKPANPKTPADPVAWGVRLMYGKSLDSRPTGGKGVTVAVLDTGVSRNHSDLKARISGCSDFTGVSALIENKCDDGNGHGSHVAGILAADGGRDGKGIYGLVPEAAILAYKVCANDGTCFADDVAAAIRTAVDYGANVIVISVGSDTESIIVTDAITYAADRQVLVVAAAGNDGDYPGSLDWPAADPHAVSVGAVDSDIDVPDWSARGANDDTKAYVRERGDIEFAAPGVNIQSTGNNNDYYTLSGTSMAAAHVAGLAAKLWQEDAKKPADATRELLHKLTLDILPPGDDNASGWGLPTL